jgi:hypothetical protein
LAAAQGTRALFAAGAFVSASAAVVGFLAESASVQGLVTASQLPCANARLQLVQSSAALAGPALMGLAVLQGWTMQAYLLAGLITAFGLDGPRLRRPAGPRAARPPAHGGDCRGLRFHIAASHFWSASWPAPFSGTWPSSR